MKNHPGLTLFLLVGLASSLHAQADPKAKNPPASVPVAGLRPGLSWKVERLPESHRTRLSQTQAADRRSPAKPPLEMLEENLTGQGFRKQIMYLPGLRLVRYRVGKVVAIESAQGDEFVLETPGEETPGGPLGSRQLDEFLWVGPEFYAGSAWVDGIDCDIYISPWPLVRPPDGAPASEAPRPGTTRRAGSTILAAISKLDRRPVRLENPLQIRRYQFESLKNPPELPAAVNAALQKQEAAIRAEIQKYQLPQ